MRSLPAAAVCALLLLWVAAYNGFPAFSYDTGAYIYSSFDHHLPLGRPIAYGLFIALSRIFGASLWYAVLLQTFLLTGVLWVCLRHLLPQSSSADKVCVFLALAVGSSVPWFAGFLMADVFTGCLALSLFLILFRWESLSKLEKWLTGIVFFIAVSVHASHWAIVLLLLVVFSRRRGIRNLTVALSLTVFSFTALSLTTHFLSGSFSITRGSHLFLLSRLVKDGLIQELLSERCQDKGYALCRHQEKLKELKDRNESFLWSPDSPLNESKGSLSPAEVNEMIWDSVKSHPGHNLTAAIAGTWQQFFDFGTGTDYHSLTPAHAAFNAIRIHYPENYPRFLASRQENDRFGPLLARLGPLHYGIGIISIFLSLLFCIFYKAPESPFLAFSLVFLAANASVCAVFSGVDSRYQSRVVWLVSLGITVLLVNWLRRGKINAK